MNVPWGWRPVRGADRHLNCARPRVAHGDTGDPQLGPALDARVGVLAWFAQLAAESVDGTDYRGSSPVLVRSKAVPVFH